MQMDMLYTIKEIRPGADCGSDHQPFNAKFRFKFKKVGKTIRPFRYNLNQIPYDYTVEVTNRFKWLDLVDSMSEELWTEVGNIVQEAVTETIPKKCKKVKCLPEQVLQIADKRREAKNKELKEWYTQLQSIILYITLCVKCVYIYIHI